MLVLHDLYILPCIMKIDPDDINLAISSPKEGGGNDVMVHRASGHRERSNDNIEVERYQTLDRQQLCLAITPEISLRNMLLTSPVGFV